MSIKKWNDDIPAGGVLCKHKNGTTILIKQAVGKWGFDVSSLNSYYLDDLTPLTAAEMWDLMPWQDMKDAPPDTALLIIYDEPSWGSYTQELEKAYFDEHTQKWRFWLNDNEISTHENGIIKWLPLPQVSK